MAKSQFDIQQVLDDLKCGENIDSYVTILVTCGLIIVSLLGVSIDKWVTPVTLAVLAIITSSSIVNRRQIDEVMRKASKLSEEFSQEIKKPTEMLLEKVVVSQALMNTGLQQVAFNLTQVEWKQLFNKAEEIDLFFVYARTWRTNNISYLTEFVNRKNTQLRVVLPDPDNMVVLQELSNRMNKPVEEFQRSIIEAKNEFLALREAGVKSGGAKVDIWLASVTPIYSLYRFDERAVLTLNSYQLYRGNVPHFVAINDGFLYKFVDDEFQILIGPDSPRNITQRIT